MSNEDGLRKCIMRAMPHDMPTTSPQYEDFQRAVVNLTLPASASPFELSLGEDPKARAAGGGGNKAY